MEAVKRTRTKRAAEDSDYEDLEEMLHCVSKRLVDRPEEITVMPARGSGFVHYEVRCDENDLGALIGKRGVHAEAIRTILSAAAAVRGIRVTVQFLSREGEFHAGR